MIWESICGTSGDTMSTRDTGNTLMNGMTTFLTPRRSSSRVGWKDIWVRIIKIIQEYGVTVAFRSPKPSVRVRVFLLLQEIEVWCNGSTTDFGSVSLGSSPGTLTKQVGLAEGFRQWSAKPLTSVRIRYPTLNPGAYRQYGSGKEVLLCFLPGLKCPCSVMDRTQHYGCFREGSSPSRGTNWTFINTV